MPAPLHLWQVGLAHGLGGRVSGARNPGLMAPWGKGIGLRHVSDGGRREADCSPCPHRESGHPSAALTTVPPAPPLTARDGPLPACAFCMYTQRMLEAVAAWLSILDQEPAAACRNGPGIALPMPPEDPPALLQRGSEPLHRFNAVARACIRSN